MLRRLVAILLVSAFAAGCSAGTASGPLEIESETRIYVDIEGHKSEIPVNPQRIVTLSEPTLDGALSLGVTPIGTVTGRGQSTAPNYLAHLASGIPILGAVAQPNFEAIGEARPDLILVDGTSINNNPPVIAMLRSIAPTVYVGYAGGDWRTTFRNTADALNKVDEGEQILADYDRRAAEIAGQLGGYRDMTFSIVRWQGSSASLILKDLPPGMALTDLGLPRPPFQDRLGRGHSEPVSLENLSQIDADIIFFGTLGGSSVDNRTAGGSADIQSSVDALAQAETVPGFTLLDAHQSGRIIPVDGSKWTSTGGPILMTSIIEDVHEALTNGAQS